MRRSPRFQRLVQMLLAMGLALAFVFSFSVTHTPAAHAQTADDGCGDGVSTTTVIQPPTKVGARTTAIYHIQLDKCTADAQSIHYRNDANNLDFCVVPSTTIGTVASFFIGAAPPIAIPVAIGSFTIAGGCSLVKAEALKAANNIAEANAYCGTAGISYNFTVSHVPARYGRSYTSLDHFECQGGSSKGGPPKSSPVFGYFDTFTDVGGVWTGTGTSGANVTGITYLLSQSGTDVSGFDEEQFATYSIGGTFNDPTLDFTVYGSGCGTTGTLTYSEDDNGAYLDGTETSSCNHLTYTVHLERQS